MAFILIKVIVLTMNDQANAVNTISITSVFDITRFLQDVSSIGLIYKLNSKIS